MPTLEGSYHKLELVQSSNNIADVVGVDGRLRFYRAMTAKLDCALFVGPTADETTFVSAVSNIISAKLTIRKRSATGDVLVNKTATFFNPINYIDWLSGSAQFTFDLSEIDTNQQLPANVPLAIYYAVSVTTNTHTFIAGTGFGEIIESGVVGVPTPMPPTLPSSTVAGDLSSGGNVNIAGTLVALSATAVLFDKGGQVFNVKAYGAAGDGITDDTNAVQAAVNAALQVAGEVFFPWGKYKITSTINFGTQNPISLRGVGSGTVIYWAFDGNLFSWTTTQFSNGRISDMMISARVSLSATSTAFYISNASGSLIKNVCTDYTSPFPHARIINLVVFDSVIIDCCYFLNCQQDAIRIGAGAEVRIVNTRLYGLTQLNSVCGIRVVGGSPNGAGGVHLINCDVINWGIGLSSEGGAYPNREIFVDDTSFDTCGIGVNLDDSVFFSSSNMWAASCVQANVRLGFGSPMVALNGGTIFNAGVGRTGGADAHGLVANTGSFTMCGVMVRNNAITTNPNGIGVFVANVGVVNYTIQGCLFYNNYRGLSLTGSNFTVLGNVFHDNTANNFIDPAASNYRYDKNVFASGGNAGEQSPFAVDVSNDPFTNVSDGASITPFGNANNFSGEFVVNEVVFGGVVKFLTGGGSMYFIGGATGYSTNAADATGAGGVGKVVVYLNSGVVTIKNRTGVLLAFRVKADRTRNTN